LNQVYSKVQTPAKPLAKKTLNVAGGLVGFDASPLTKDPVPTKEGETPFTVNRTPIRPDNDLLKQLQDAEKKRVAELEAKKKK
jgi:hypothetical protein